MYRLGKFSPVLPVPLGFTGNKLNGISRLFCSPGFGKISKCYFLGSNKINFRYFSKNPKKGKCGFSTFAPQELSVGDLGVD